MGFVADAIVIAIKTMAVWSNTVKLVNGISPPSKSGGGDGIHTVSSW